jgi:serine/threonine protein kinase
MLLGNYELRRPIGSGGMGTVFEGVHRTLGRRVAIKLLHAHSAQGPASEVAAARFLREGRAAAQVRHPHVVDVFDFGVQEGVPYLVMELVDGETLARLLQRETRLSPQRVVELVLPVLAAVAELHTAGIVHRDLKPANILLGRGRAGEVCPKVADFGVSRLDDGAPRITQSGSTVGTPEYMSPEQTRNTVNATELTDVYALGVMLYECSTGRRPFDGATHYELLHAVVTAPVTAPSVHHSSLPPEWDAVVLRAMHRDPVERFGSVDELAIAVLPFAAAAVAARWHSEFVTPPTVPLDSVSDGSAPAYANVARPLPDVPRRTRRALVAVAAGLLAVLGLVGLRHPARRAPPASIAAGEVAPSPVTVAAEAASPPLGAPGASAHDSPPVASASPSSASAPSAPSASAALCPSPRASVSVSAIPSGHARSTPRALPLAAPTAAHAASPPAAAPALDNDAPVIDVP